MARPKKEPLGPPTIAEDFIPIHPALDFWEHRNGTGTVSYHAIISVGEYFRQDYVSGDVDLYDGAICITSEGDMFPYSKRELAARSLYYSKGLDLPARRWQYADLREFADQLKNNNAPIPTIQEAYRKVKATIDFFMDFEDPRIYDLLSTFIIYTYFYPLFHHAPVLQLWGEAKTGKSKICNLLASMAFNTLNSANISESTVFRVIEGRRATILLDESEDLMSSERGKAVCNLLLAGYSKSGETFRQEKSSDDKYKTANYKVFGPKVIANISGISLTPLFSRIIRVITRGALNKSKSNRDVDMEDPMFLSIRNTLYRLALTTSKYVVESRKNLPDTLYEGAVLNDRVRGIWEGMLTIAHMSGEEVWKGMLAYAHENNKAMQDEIDATNNGTALLKQLFLLTEEYGDRDYRVGEIMDWIERTEGLELNTKKEIGLLMKKLGYKSKPKREGQLVYKVYDLTNEDILHRLKRT